MLHKTQIHVAELQEVVASHGSGLLASQGLMGRAYHFEFVREKLASLAISVDPSQRVAKALRNSVDTQSQWLRHRTHYRLPHRQRASHTDQALLGKTTEKAQAWPGGMPLSLIIGRCLHHTCMT